MVPQQYDLHVQKGGTFKFAIKLMAGNSVMNLGGYKARSQMREDYDSPNAFLTFTTDDGTINIDTVAGKLTMVAMDSDTSAITADSGVWDLELLAPTGDVYPILYGKVYIGQEVTRNSNL